jgi:hypothetical protein
MDATFAQLTTLIVAITAAIPVLAAAIVGVIRAIQGKDILPSPNLTAKVDAHVEAQNTQNATQNATLKVMAGELNGAKAAAEAVAKAQGIEIGKEEQRKIDSPSPPRPVIRPGN